MGFVADIRYDMDHGGDRRIIAPVIAERGRSHPPDSDVLELGFEALKPAN